MFESGKSDIELFGDKKIRQPIPGLPANTSTTVKAHPQAAD